MTIRYVNPAHDGECNAPGPCEGCDGPAPLHPLTGDPLTVASLKPDYLRALATDDTTVRFLFDQLVIGHPDLMAARDAVADRFRSRLVAARDRLTKCIRTDEGGRHVR